MTIVDRLSTSDTMFAFYDGVLWQSRKPRLRTLAAHIASTVQAFKNCIEAHNNEWRDKHLEAIREYEDMLPSGSGIDGGTKIDIDRSSGDKLVLTFSYHHMNDCGMYDGWNDYTCYVRPAFDGITLSIRGRNRNDIMDYLYEVYNGALTELTLIEG